MDWTVVGKRIRIAREFAGLTQEELAARLEMSPTHISVLERGINAYTWAETRLLLLTVKTQS